MLTLLILTFQSLRKNIDVFLRPLIDKLKDLCSLGLQTRDAVDGDIFNICDALTWTANDFLV